MTTKELTLITRNYKDIPIRMIQKEGEVWFVARDVCDVLGIKHMASSIRAIPDDEKGVQRMHTPGGEQELSILSESGRYRLTMRCDKPEAKPFQDWVVKEVLPSIRRTGSYSLNPEISLIQQIIDIQAKLAERFQSFENRVSALESSPVQKLLPPVRPQSIRSMLNQIVRNAVQNDLKNTTFEEAWNHLYTQFYYRYGINLPLRARNSKAKNILDTAEQLHMMNDLLALAVNIFVTK